MSDLNRLMKHMQLEPIVADTLNFGDFLERLKNSPEIADTAPALILRAIKGRGKVEIDKEPESRRPYLELLQAMRIPAWKAFDHVRGSQRTVHRIMNHLEAAAANGYQLRQALLLIGGPGCGKSFLADAIKATLEGELVYVVDGCPVHENPINLLHLLRPEQVAALAEALGMDDPAKGPTLQSLLTVAGEPCKHCWKKVMMKDCKGDEFHEEPNLAEVSIKEVRLASRNFGISTWTQTAGGCSLVEAIRQGSSGVVDIPELCSVQVPMPGQTLEVDALIDATDARRIPDLSSCGDNAGTLPVNLLIIGQSNQGSWDNFLKNQKDPNKFTRRMNIFSVPYITAAVEEELVYKGFVAQLKKKPHFDPNALSLAATLAVGSRLKTVPTLSPLDKVRIYNGENFVVRKMIGSNYGSGTASLFTDKELMEMLKKSNEEVKDESSREGMFGLNLPFMLAFVSQVAESHMRGPRHPAFPQAEPCVTAIGMIDALRGRLEAFKDTNGLTDQERKVVETCLTEWLKKPKDTTDTPGLLEREYRRLLRQQILDAFSPDYERRAKEMFDKYRLHARAFGNSLTKVKLPNTNKEVDVEVGFLDLIDKGQSLRSQLPSVRDYRGSIDAQINDLMYSRGTLPSEDAETLTIDWTTLPELKQAIEDFLNAEIAKKVERILSKKYDLLSEDDKEAFDVAFASFKEHGYCEICFERALEYAKELKLWAKSQD